ncbi:MAG: sensor histidine kinase [Kutzneria sp.]|nr:sensor histidine kinase [Kutzneria sp.]
MVAWLTVFPIVLALLLGPDALLFATYAVSAALMLLPRNIGGLIGLGFAAALLIGTSVVDGTAKWGAVLTLAAVTVMTFTVSGLVTTVKELRRTHGMAAKLAVAEERARLARDLHDVLGHSLTTITVKAGLARRLLESSPDRDRAVAEVRDVEDLARQALSDVRATVSGHRVSSLPAELVGARAALQAAGITADLPHATDNVTAGLQETFAYVLREGVTNVIRHSAATRCEVRLGERWLEVRDNGTAGQRIATASLVGERGHGLSGLADRMRSVGGDLEAGPGPGGGFLLRASVCTPAPDTTNVDLP